MRPITEDEVRQRLEGSTIELLHYSGVARRVKSTFRCTKCSHVWEGVATVIAARRNCPACIGYARVTAESVAQKLIGRNIELVTFGGTGKEKSLFRCLACYTEWMARPDAVVRRGTGCPRCCSNAFKLDDMAEFYGYRIKMCSGEYLGFGITTNPRERHIMHRSSFRCMGAEWEKIISTFMTGYAARTLESLMKSELDCVNTGIPGFKTEAVMLTPAAWKHVSLLTSHFAELSS